MTTIQSAIEELEKQMARGFALVASARDALVVSGAHPGQTAATLLDMAEDELSDLRLVLQIKAQVAASWPP
jgi:hypothetical protein